MDTLVIDSAHVHPAVSDLGSPRLVTTAPATHGAQVQVSVGGCRFPGGIPLTGPQT